MCLQDSDPEERGGMMGVQPIKVGSDSDDSEDFKDVVSVFLLRKLCQFWLMHF